MSTNIKTAKKRKISKPLVFCIVAMIPTMALYTYLRFLPILETFYLSFHNWDLVSLNKPFIGLSNYRKLFASDIFLKSLKDTTIIAFCVLLFTVPLSLIIANALVKRVRSKSWFEAIYFLPVIMPVVPTTVAWKEILDANYGIFNYFLSFFGVKPLPWLIDPNLSLISVIIIIIWKNIGYNMLIFSVGLTGISKEYYEAASLDGATGFKAFRYITIPLIKPVTVFVSIMTLIKGYNVFSTAYILASDTQGSPGYVVRVLVYDMYENGFRFYKMGYASAEAVILFLIVFILTIVQFALTRDREGKKHAGERVKT